VKKIGFVLAVTLLAFLCATAGAAPAGADFEGRWRSGDNEMTITNITEKSFEFSFEGFSVNAAGVPHMGDLAGTALFTAGNKAVFNYEDEYGDKKVKYEFIVNDGELIVSVAEGDETGLFGVGVYMNGTYTKPLTGAASSEDSYVRLAIKGTNVNLRPQPLGKGRVVAQMNTGDVFIAEKRQALNSYDNSKWYRIVLAVSAKTGKIGLLSEWDSRFKANAAFVHADFATVSSLAEGDMEKISATPVGVKGSKVLPDSLLDKSGSIAGYWADISYSDGPYLRGYYFAKDGTGSYFMLNEFEITSYTYANGDLSYTYKISEGLAEAEGYEPGPQSDGFKASLLHGNYLAMKRDDGEYTVYNRVSEIENTGWSSFIVTQLDGSVFQIGEGRLIDAR